MFRCNIAEEFAGAFGGGVGADGLRDIHLFAEGDGGRIAVDTGAGGDYNFCAAMRFVVSRGGEDVRSGEDIRAGIADGVGDAGANASASREMNDSGGAEEFEHLFDSGLVGNIGFEEAEEFALRPDFAFESEEVRAFKVGRIHGVEIIDTDNASARGDDRAGDVGANETRSPSDQNRLIAHEHTPSVFGLVTGAVRGICYYQSIILLQVPGPGQPRLRRFCGHGGRGGRLQTRCGGRSRRSFQ